MVRSGGNRQDVFSFSRVTSFEQCARRYRYRYLDGVQEAFQGIEGFMGNRVHDAVEWLFREREHQRVHDAARLVGWYTEAFDRELSAASGRTKVVKQGRSVEDYRRDGAAMLADFHRMRFGSDDLETVGLERHFELQLPGGQRFQGFIDRLARDASGTLHIIDYKTGSRPATRFEGKDAQQLEAYAVAMFAEDSAVGAGESIELRLEYLRNASVVRRTIRRDEALEVGRRLAARIDYAATATVFPPSPGVLCGWCGFNDVCEAAPQRKGR